MKIKLSKSQWEEIGKKAGWVKTADYGKEIYDPKLNTEEAKMLWFKMNDYMTMADDPSYRVAIAFRNAINKIKDPRDKNEMMKYFESEFGGSHTKEVGAWKYYEKE